MDNFRIQKYIFLLILQNFIGNYFKLFYRYLCSMAGQPAYYSTAEELQSAIDDYLESDDCDFTITGLALSLGFCSRQSFYDYEERPEYSYTIKKARLHIEHSYEKGLRSKDAGGAIFALKNMGWKDKTEHDNNHNFPQLTPIIIGDGPTE